MSTVPLGTKYSAKILRPLAPWDEAVACSTPQILSLTRSKNKSPGLCPKQQINMNYEQKCLFSSK
jgi:hypothetical protein